MNTSSRKRLLILSDPNSPHTQKWIRALSSKGFKIYLFGLTPYADTAYEEYQNVQVFSMDMKLSNTEVVGTRLTKLKYLTALPKIKKIINDFKPQLLHAHYATSYGLLGSLTGFHPFITSLWGSDIYDFPNKSILYQNILHYVLNRSEEVLSTSKVMAIEAFKYYKKEITVTPFGVDVKLFKTPETYDLFAGKEYVIGTAKNLEDVYGIDVLMKSFTLLKEKQLGKPIILIIIGSGTKENYLRQLARELGIDKETFFPGRIKNDDLPKFFSKMDVVAFLSRQESFGVAALEAMACERPVVATNVGGYKEIIVDAKNGYLVEPENPEQVADKIYNLLMNEDLSISIGKKGRERVIKDYNFEDSLNKMLAIYDKYL